MYSMGIYLSNKKLLGEIPISLEGCQKLELIDLAHNNIEGTIPPKVIVSIGNLQLYLNISWNSLQGPFPWEVSKIVMS